MFELSKKVVNLLKENGITDNEILSVISNIYNDIYNDSVVELEIGWNSYNSIRDIVWYNFEFKSDSDTFKDWGTEYPYFMNGITEDLFYHKDVINDLYNEINKLHTNVKNNIDKIYIVSLSNNNNINLFDKVKMLKPQQEPGKSILYNCFLFDKIDSFTYAKINQLLTKFDEACKKALEKNTGIKIKILE